MGNKDTSENCGAEISSVPISPSTVCPTGMNLRKLGLGVLDVSIAMRCALRSSKEGRKDDVRNSIYYYRCGR